MGMMVADLYKFIENHEYELKRSTKEIQMNLDTLKKQVNALDDELERLGETKFQNEEFAYFLPPLNIVLILCSLKDICAYAIELDIKIDKRLKNKIDRQYSIWLPEQSEEHIKTMNYIINSDKYGNDLFSDLKSKKATGELYFENFDELNYDDLVLLWHICLQMDSYIQELYSLKSRSTVTTKRKNLFINEHRMNALRVTTRWKAEY